jgi:GTP cyclohydrolase FolE2
LTEDDVRRIAREEIAKHDGDIARLLRSKSVESIHPRPVAPDPEPTRVP